MSRVDTAFVRTNRPAAQPAQPPPKTLGNRLIGTTAEVYNLAMGPARPTTPFHACLRGWAVALHTSIMAVTALGT